jgi:hypothetical protein
MTIDQTPLEKAALGQEETITPLTGRRVCGLSTLPGNPAVCYRYAAPEFIWGISL